MSQTRGAGAVGGLLTGVWLLASLAGAAADPSQLRLRDDFEGEGFGAAGGLFYKDNEEQRAGRYRTQSAVVRSGSRALELWVVPQCRKEQRSCSERAEVWERPDVLAGYDKALWYAFSIKFDDPAPSAAHRYVVAQWKRGIKPDAKGDYSPYLAVRVIRGKLAVTIDSDAMPSTERAGTPSPVACGEGATPAMQRRRAQQTRLLVAQSGLPDPAIAIDYGHCAPGVQVIQRRGLLPEVGKGWIDFVFKVRPGPGGDGAIEIFANGGWVASVRGRIGHESPELRDNQYFKFGPYRDGGQSDLWRLFYDDFRRGPQCEDVAPAAVCRQVDG